MRKKFLLVLLAIGVIGMTACMDEGQAESSSVQESVAQTESVKIDLEESESSSEEVSSKQEVSSETEDSSGEVVEQTGTDKYQEFLKGNELVYYNYIGMNYGDAAVDDTGYSLSDMLESFDEQYWGMEQEPTVEYAYLDCGNDGVEELAVRFVGMGIYSPGDDSTLVLIIKEIDEKLELCYLYETWARSETTLNQYGYITSGGSNGASNHGYGAGYIDAAGKWNYLYYMEEEVDINQLAFHEALANVPVVAETKEYEGNIIVCTTTFEDMSSPEAYLKAERFYSYAVDGVEGDVYSEGVYKEIFDEAGVKFYLPEEIDAMILDKEASLGITEEIKSAPKLTWEKL